MEMITDRGIGWNPYHFFIFLLFYFLIMLLFQQGLAKGQKICIRIISSFKQKYLIRKQRQTIRNILNHIKHLTRKVTNYDLKEYLYHLGTIINVIANLT